MEVKEPGIYWKNKKRRCSVLNNILLVIFYLSAGAVIVFLRVVLSLIFNSTLSKRGWLVE